MNFQGINELTLRGNLTKDPVFGHGSSTGTAYCFITVAVNRPYVSKGEAKMATTYTGVTLFKKQAVLANETMKKGSFVEVKCTVEDRSREVNGQKVYETKVFGHFIKNLTPTKNDAPAETTEEVGSY
jgi:single stranded DNA-binding protein